MGQIDDLKRDVVEPPAGVYLWSSKVHLNSKSGQGAFPLDSGRQRLGKLNPLSGSPNHEDARVYYERLVREQLAVLRVAGYPALDVRHPGWVNENGRVDFLRADYLYLGMETHVYRGRFDQHLIAVRRFDNQIAACASRRICHRPTAALLARPPPWQCHSSPPR